MLHAEKIPIFEWPLPNLWHLERWGIFWFPLHIALWSLLGSLIKQGPWIWDWRALSSHRQLGINSMTLSSLRYLKCTMKITKLQFLFFTGCWWFFVFCFCFFPFPLPPSPPFLGAFPFICFVFGLACGQKVFVSIHVPLRSLLVKYCCITNSSKFHG